jgi:hypothetical protein
MEASLPWKWSPDANQNSSIRIERRGRHVVSSQSRLTVGEELVEDFVARVNAAGANHLPQEAIVWKLVSEGERAGFNLSFDLIQALACAAEIGFRWSRAEGRRTDEERLCPSESSRHGMQAPTRAPRRLLVINRFITYLLHLP